MSELPESPNFFAALHTPRSRRSVSKLFERPTWAVRKCAWYDYEAESSFAELVIEAESPILVHGPVAGIEDAERIVALLRTAGIAHDAELYDSTRALLREWTWAVPEASDGHSSIRGRIHKLLAWFRGAW